MFKAWISLEARLAHTCYTVGSNLGITGVKWWRRQWHPTPVLLPGKSHGQRSLVGCRPWGHEESDTTEGLHFHFPLLCIGEGNGNPLLAWRIPGTGEPGGLLSMGSHRVWHDWSDLAAAAGVKWMSEKLTWLDCSEQGKDSILECKTKLQWGATSRQSEWPSLKSLHCRLYK